MIRNLLSSVFALALVHLASAQPSGSYENFSSVLCPPAIPPQIDATSFLNHGRFTINLTNLIMLFTDPTASPQFTVDPYETADTLVYSNFFGALLSCNTGFRFGVLDSQTGLRRASSSFFNQGVIKCGTTDTTNLNPIMDFGDAQLNYFWFTVQLGIFQPRLSFPKLLVNADQLFNPGEIDLGFQSHCVLAGNNVNLSRGAVVMDQSSPIFPGAANPVFLPQSSFLFDRGGLYDGYWGNGGLFIFGTADPQVLFETPNPRTPPHSVTYRDYHIDMKHTLVLSNALTFLSDLTDITGSNRFVRAVFINNTNAAITPSVFFPNNVTADTNLDAFGFPVFGDIVVEWSSVFTNSSGVASTNYIDLFDSLLLFGTSTNSLQLDGVASPGIGGFGLERLTFIPNTYQFLKNLSTSASTFFGPPVAPQVIPPGTFFSPFGLFFTTYTAYEASFSPLSSVVSDIPHQDVTNLTGRIEIVATNLLDLSRARITSLNYLQLKAPKHFAGSSGAQISSPFTDLDLRSTNGVLAITNLVAPSIHTPEGVVDLFSAEWTDVFGFVTNHFHVLFVDAHLAPEAPARIQTLTLHSTNAPGRDDNLFISDVLNVTRSMTIDTARLTITTNGPGSPMPTGGINFVSPDIVWSTALPRLQYLTNNGFINAQNSVFFGGSRTSPYYSSTFNQPYFSFVNTGGVTNFNTLIWATNFQNSGTFLATLGGIHLQDSLSALLTNGAFLAPSPAGDISIESSSLFVSNYVFQAGAAFSFTVTNFLDDGSFFANSADTISNKNVWTVGNGFNLLRLPPRASLLGTSVTNVSPPFVNQVNLWAGANRGNDPDGFRNNAALGRLILDGGTNSIFTFAPATGSNALYVDSLELKNYAGALDASGNSAGVAILPGMKIYYAQLLIDGNSFAEKLNGKNGGGFVWISNYHCGFFSSTNLIYPDGSTNRVNAALAQSCDIDSNTNGIVNCNDPAPIPPSDIPNCNPPLLVAGSPAAILSPVNRPADGVSQGGPVTAPPLALPPAAPADSLSYTFASAQGTYYGLFADTNGVAVPSSGYFTATVTARGAFTARIMLAGRSCSVSGYFDPATGLAVKAVRLTPALTLTVRLQLDLSGTDQIRGSISDGHWRAELVADRAVFNKSKAKAPQAGSYTMIIPPQAPGPGGCGFATLKVDPAGTLQWAATLADGSKVTQSGALSKQGFWPLFASLYNGAGSVISWMQFAPEAYSDLSGRFVWTKPLAPGAKLYPRGFTNEVQAIGSTYAAPAPGTRALDLDSLGANLIFSGAATSTFTNVFSLDMNNRLTGASGSKLSLSISTASGLFKGAARNPDSGQLFPFQGVLMERTGFGAGFFLGTDLSGQVYLAPRLK